MNAEARKCYFCKNKLIEIGFYQLNCKLCDAYACCIDCYYVGKEYIRSGKKIKCDNCKKGLSYLPYYKVPGFYGTGPTALADVVYFKIDSHWPKRFMYWGNKGELNLEKIMDIKCYGNKVVLNLEKIMDVKWGLYYKIEFTDYDYKKFNSATEPWIHYISTWICSDNDSSTYPTNVNRVNDINNDKVLLYNYEHDVTDKDEVIGFYMHF